MRAQSLEEQCKHVSTQFLQLRLKHSFYCLECLAWLHGFMRRIKWTAWREAKCLNRSTLGWGIFFGRHAVFIQTQKLLDPNFHRYLWKPESQTLLVFPWDHIWIYTYIYTHPCGIFHIKGEVGKGFLKLFFNQIILHILLDRKEEYHQQAVILPKKMPKPPMLNQPKKKVIRACFFALTRSLNQFQFEGCYLMNLSLQKLQDEKKGHHLQHLWAHRTR